MYPLNSILETNFSIPANPFSLQISSQLVARGAGGRGEALGSAPTPEGGWTGRASFKWDLLLGTQPLPPTPSFLLLFTRVSAQSRKCIKFSSCRCGPDSLTRCFTYIKPLVLKIKIDDFFKAPGHPPGSLFEASGPLLSPIASQKDPQSIKNLTKSAK